MSQSFARQLLLGLIITGLAGVPSAMAQQTRLSPAAIGQITDAVMGEILPLDSRVSRVLVSKRTVVFDHDRTMAAFEKLGHPGVPFSELELRTPVIVGTKAVLDDCSQTERRACMGLGWRVYAWIEALSVSDTAARVRGHFLWADRGNAVYEEGIAPTGGAFLVGMSAEVYLTRGKDGAWKFSRRGTIVAGD